MLFNKTKTTMVDPEDALPGRDAPIRVPERHFVLGNPLKPPVPRGPRQTPCSAWAASGAPSGSSGSARRLHDRGRLRGRLHAEPDLRGGLQRPHRPHRGRARRLRPREDQLRGDAAHLLGGPRPDPGHAPGQRRRHPVPLGDLLRRRRPARGRRGLARSCSSRAPERRRLRRDHHRDRGRRARSTTPRTTTSSTWPRTPTGTAASAGPASAARSAWGRPRRPRPLGWPVVGWGGCARRADASLNVRATRHPPHPVLRAVRCRGVLGAPSAPGGWLRNRFVAAGTCVSLGARCPCVAVDGRRCSAVDAHGGW